MRVVLDASAAIEVALGRSQAGAFAPLLGDADEVVAPDPFVPEVVTTFWKYHRFENLSVDACDRAIELALGLVDVLVPSKELHREAWLLARIARRPADDTFYLALARREDATFLTTDAPLRKEAERQGIRVAQRQYCSRCAARTTRLRSWKPRPGAPWAGSGHATRGRRNRSCIQSFLLNQG